MIRSIKTKTRITGKKFVILGAGTVVRGFLTKLILDHVKVEDIEVYNRTLNNARKIAKEFKIVSKVGSIDDLENASGDIFINATPIGSPWCENPAFEFDKDFVDRFKFIADVTFVPLESQLIKIAKKLKKPYSPGYKMFLYQGQMCLEKILNIKVNLKVLEKRMIHDFKLNWS